VGTHECVRARWTTAVTGMFEAYPIEESARLHGSGCSLAARVFPRTPLPTRGTHDLATPAADASEHDGRIFIMTSIFEVKRRKSNSPISHSLMIFFEKNLFLKIFM
jgi:hypothetical protein